MSTVKHQVVIIGGGTGGIMMAAQLKKAKKSLDIVIIDPTKTHAYQPAWTLVGAGFMKLEQTIRKEKKLSPSGVGWIQERVSDIKAEDNQVILDSGDIVDYEYLVVAPGIQINIDGIKASKSYGIEVSRKEIFSESQFKSFKHFGDDRYVKIISFVLFYTLLKLDKPYLLELEEEKVKDILLNSEYFYRIDRNIINIYLDNNEVFDTIVKDHMKGVR